MKNNKPLKNVFSIVFGRAGELVLSFFAITLLIRYLGASQYGTFTAIVAMVTIFSRFIDLGFSQIVFREFSSNQNDNSILNRAISIRLIVLVLFMSLFNIYAQLQMVNVEEIIMTNILFTNIIFASRFRNIRDILEIPFKAKLRMDVVMVCTFLDNFLLLILIITGSYLEFDLVTITLFYTLANIPGFLVLISVLIKKHNFKFRFDLSSIKWLLSESLPLWGTGLLLALFLQLDVVIIKNFLSREAAGLYSASLRIGVPLQVIPLAIITTVFPVLVKKRENDIKEANEITEFSFKILILLLVFCATLITFKSNEILVLLYGDEFSSASDALSLVIWSFPFFYINQLSQN